MFNLSVKDHNPGKCTLVDSVKALMINLGLPLRRATLQRLIELAPVKCNEKRWSSGQAVLERYMQFKEQPSCLGILKIN